MTNTDTDIVNISRPLTEMARLQPDTPAIIFPEEQRRLSFRELDRVSQTLTGRIRELAERYASPLPQLVDEVVELAAKVDGHLRRMGVKG